VGEDLIDAYKRNPKSFSEKMVDLLMEDSDIYKEKIKAIERGISNIALIDLLIQLREELKPKTYIDPEKELEKYENKFESFEKILIEQAKERNLSEKDWKIMISDIILSTNYGILPTIELFLKIPEISKKEKIKGLSKLKNIIRLINYSSIHNPGGSTEEIISKIKKYLGSEAIEDILKESFISLKTYNKIYS
jgi:chemotaxis protein histidine kinase CheA